MTKRPDQHNIDPSEGGATDYKNLPQTGRGTKNRDDTVDLDRRNLTTPEEEDQGPIPQKRPRPGEDVRRAQREQRKAEDDSEGDGDA